MVVLELATGRVEILDLKRMVHTEITSEQLEESVGKLKKAAGRRHRKAREGRRPGERDRRGDGPRPGRAPLPEIVRPGRQPPAPDQLLGRSGRDGRARPGNAGRACGIHRQGPDRHDQAERRPRPGIDSSLRTTGGDQHPRERAPRPARRVDDPVPSRRPPQEVPLDLPGRTPPQRARGRRTLPDRRTVRPGQVRPLRAVRLAKNRNARRASLASCSRAGPGPRTRRTPANNRRRTRPPARTRCTRDDPS